MLGSTPKSPPALAMKTLSGAGAPGSCALSHGTISRIIDAIVGMATWTIRRISLLRRNYIPFFRCRLRELLHHGTRKRLFANQDWRRLVKKNGIFAPPTFPGITTPCRHLVETIL